MYKSIHCCILCRGDKTAQYRNRKTVCPHCNEKIGNSGFKNHLTACEKKHKDTETETQTNPQNRTEEEQTPEQTEHEPQTETEEEEEEEMPEHVDAELVEAEQVIIVHDGKKKKDGPMASTDNFFDSLGRFLENYGEVLGAAVAPIAAAYAERSQPPEPEEEEITGEEW